MSLLSSVLTNIFGPVDAPEPLHLVADPGYRRTVVIAGSHQQARYWMREIGWGPRDFIYVPTVERFHGFSPESTLVVFCGTWLEHEDAMELHHLATSMGFTIVE
jgi:hypothetical protein